MSKLAYSNQTKSFGKLMDKPLTLIHLSDLHFVNDQSIWQGLIENRKVVSKRHLGWLNYKLRRHQHFDYALRERTIDFLLKAHWDYLIITGDLATLALPSEFEQARTRMEPLLAKGPVLLTTGNHDRYVITSPQANLLSHYFQDCWPFNQASWQEKGHCFFEIGEEAVILELDMAIPRAFYSSRGRLAENLDALKNILKKDYKNRLKIAIGHYPAFLPPGEHEGFLHSLAGKEGLRKFLLECGFRFYLHGHIHKSWMFDPVVSAELTCVNSAGCCRYATGQWSGFHRILLTGREATIERVNVI